MTRRMPAVALVLLGLTTAVVPALELVYYPRDSQETVANAPRFVVPDPDAQSGTAQAALPGKSQPGSTICSLYAYARPAGIYVVTWRAKVGDNTITDVVFHVRYTAREGGDALKAEANKKIQSLLADAAKYSRQP